MALLVLPLGAQRMVLPPPVADPMHWSTVTPAVVVPTGTLLVTVTSQYTLLPPPVTMPLHWFTDVTSWLDEVVLIVAVVALVVILLGMRLFRSSDRRRRRSTDMVYIDRDAARYGRASPATTTDRVARAPRGGPATATHYGTDQPMAPTFNSPKRTVRSGPAHQPPPPPSRSTSPWAATPSP